MQSTIECCSNHLAARMICSKVLGDHLFWQGGGMQCEPDDQASIPPRSLYSFSSLSTQSSWWKISSSQGINSVSDDLCLCFCLYPSTYAVQCVPICAGCCSHQVPGVGRNIQPLHLQYAVTKFPVKKHQISVVFNQLIPPFSRRV